MPSVDAGIVVDVTVSRSSAIILTFFFLFIKNSLEKTKFVENFLAVRYFS
jgi:hypothetical protein